jgi:hypothetical protein
MNANPQDPPEPDGRQWDATAQTPREERKRLLAALREARGSDVLLTYITSTRPVLEAAMALDAVRCFYDHLPSNKVDQLDLVIHSNGGDGVVPWRLMTLLHEYAEKVDVLVPHRAFSAATLAALGAHEIMMHPMGMLGPIDASINNPLGPVNPMGQPVPVSGEDVAAYYDLVREDLGIRQEEQLLHAFQVLAEKVHPLVLGNVKRGSAQSRMLGEKLIALRSKVEQEHRDLLEQITTKLYYHGHPINRIEAKELGLPIADPVATTEDALWNLYLAYEGEMHMTTPFDPVAMALTGGLEPPISPPPGPMGQQLVYAPYPELLTVPMVMVESEGRCDTFEQDLQLSVARGPMGMYHGNVVALRAEWVASP